jgi:hypothetical protein
VLRPHTQPTAHNHLCWNPKTTKYAYFVSAETPTTTNYKYLSVLKPHHYQLHVLITAVTTIQPTTRTYHCCYYTTTNYTYSSVLKPHHNQLHVLFSAQNIPQPITHSAETPPQSTMCTHQHWNHTTITQCTHQCWNHSTPFTFIKQCWNHTTNNYTYSSVLKQHHNQLQILISAETPLHNQTQILIFLVLKLHHNQLRWVSVLKPNHNQLYVLPCYNHTTTNYKISLTGLL